MSPSFRLVPLAEEFGSWDDSRRRIDLLCLDGTGNLVVVELKRSEDAGHVELQAIRYAAMVSTMTFDQAVRAHAAYLKARSSDQDAEEAILAHLGWDEPDEEQFGVDVRIVLVAADFSKEVTTSVLWLNERDLDIRCVRLRPYRHGGRVLLDVQQVLPLPEVEEYQVRVREKERLERSARKSARDYTKFDVTLDGVVHERLNKRLAIHTVVSHLWGKGHRVDEIAAAIPWRKRKNLFFEVDGEVDAEGFVEAATAKATTEGRAFDRRRWYCGDGELLVDGGATCALTNQWGGRAVEALRNLTERFTEDGIDVNGARVICGRLRQSAKAVRLVRSRQGSRSLYRARSCKLIRDVAEDNHGIYADHLH